MSPHGTVSRYTNGRCRCTPCTAAQTKLTLEHTRKRVASGDYRCPCGERDRAAFFPSMPWRCKVCHTDLCERRRKTPEGRRLHAARMRAWYARHPGYRAEQSRRTRARKAEAELIRRINSTPTDEGRDAL